MRKLTIEEFIKKATSVHGDKYDYSRVNYVNNKTKVCIGCPVHGFFEQSPDSHLGGSGCLSCGGCEKRTLEKFIEEAKKIHGDKYDYSKVNYVNNKTRVCIICPEHGEFWQTPRAHICKKHGCPKCNESQLERDIRLLLTENNIKYETEKTWNWLIFNSYQFVDYYLPEYNLVIECQGKQHFETSDFFNKDADLEKIQERDKNKYEKCIEHGIRVIYYSTVPNVNTKYSIPYKVYETTSEILDTIRGISLTN